ncbi:ArsR/SmtB family transcription factor [Ruegeria discodermiae]|uniref:ArsR/SmtB family transcription factor n=1 Tax=Ruegeria discodermiae TaxID=3064389 RepID=UPI0035326BE3
MGDSARINMLIALRFDCVLSAKELAAVANIAPSTASEHLTKLTVAGLISCKKVGRSRLYSITDGDVCDLIDGITAHADRIGSRHEDKSRLPKAVKHSRLCLDHLGGELGCLVSNAMFSGGYLRHTPKGPEVTRDGEGWLSSHEIGKHFPNEHLRCPLRLCHDWTHGGYHLGGGIAAALLATFVERDWLRTRRGEIAVSLTPKGITGLGKTFGLDLRQVTG